MTTAHEQRQKWDRVKAKIIVRFGSVTACAAAIGRSDEAIRQAVAGKCPGVAKQLKEALK